MKKSENNKESSSASSSSGACPEAPIVPGCGSTTETDTTITEYNASINLNITTTTGGNFSVLVDVQNSVENLKKIIAKRLKVAKDRICLLHRERELQDGNLKENGLVDGSKIILIPNVETGLLAQRPENTVMQALESLNDAQVNDFLSGKTPLNLSMRLGDHMMLIQLQLSTVSPSSPPHNRSRPRSRSGRSSASSSTSSSSSSSSTIVPCTLSTSNLQNNITTPPKTTDLLEQNQQQQHGVNQGVSTISQIHHSDSIPDGELDSFLSRHGFDSIDDIVKNFAFPDDERTTATIAKSSSYETKTTNVLNNCCSSATLSNLNNSFNNASTMMDQSPIKSLSNLVSNPLKSTNTTPIKTSNSNSNSITSNFIENLNNVSHIERASMCSDPISAKLTSCLCKRLDGTANTTTDSNSCSNTSRECEISHCQFKNELSSPVDISANSTESMITEPSSENFEKTTSTNHSATRFSSIYSPHSVGSSSLLHKTVNNPIGKSKHRLHSSVCNVLKKNISFDKQRHNIGNNSIINGDNSSSLSNNEAMIIDETAKATTQIVKTSSSSSSPSPSITATDARALAEASRNLTQTLRKLSKEVFTNKIDLSDHHSSRKNNSGAVIESMKNHGKGIYSGTFSGTLNPALQDQYGRPKRDISTVIHILNDLLSATPQYNRDTKISFETPLSSSSSSTSTISSCGKGSLNNKQIVKHNFSTPEQECRKCVIQNGNPKSTNTMCAYGECNGHSSSSMQSSSFMTASNTTTGSYHHQHRHHHHHSHHPHQYHMSSIHKNSHDSSKLLNASILNDNNSSSITDINLDERNLLCTCNNSYQKFVGDLNNSNNIMNITTTMCNKCSIDLENSKTKCKLDQLRLVMQQRKQKREARKLKGTPYGAIMLSSHNNSNNSNNTTGGINGLNTINDDINDGNNGNEQQTSDNNDNNTNANGSAASATTNTITSIAPPSEVSPNHIVEEVDTAA